MNTNIFGVKNQAQNIDNEQLIKQKKSGGDLAL
jgi:hypothetical protein